MKRLVAIVLLALPGCGSEWQHERAMNQTVFAEVAPGQYRTVTYRELDELNAQKALENDARRKRQAEQEEEARKTQQAELEKQNAARLKKAEARIAADEVRGYKHTTFTDFFLDYRTIPLGSKRAVSGLYQLFGEYETLTEIPSDNPWGGTPRVALLTATAPRDVRERLLVYVCRAAFCPVVLLGRTVSCTIRRLGGQARVDVCFAIDEMW
jgi:hypothetical protein